VFSAGFIGNGIVEEIEELSPPWPQRILMGVEGTEDAMLDCSLCDFVAMMQRSFYVCCTGALQAVADGVMAFATYQKRPDGCSTKYLAKKGLQATRVGVPGTKSCKVWLINRIDGAEMTSSVLRRFSSTESTNVCQDGLGTNVGKS
jgi:hypothetical protein